MKRIQLSLAVLAGLALLVAGPIYAQQAVKAEKADGKELAKLITESKMTLTKAIGVAETETKGTAVRAWAEKYPDGVRIDVHVAVGDQVKWVEVDKTGKVMFTKDVPANGNGHQKKADEKKADTKKEQKP